MAAAEDDSLRRSVLDARDALDELLADDEAMERLGAVAQALGACIEGGGKILAVGNGGSLCDAMHFCEELTGRFRNDRRPLPAIACADPAHLTCVANDYGFEHVFSRWVEALGAEGDVLVVLSTSGRSVNIIRAAEAAKTRGMTIVGLLGRDGGDVRILCDHAWVIPGRTSDRIQEVHMVILHALVEGVEQHGGPERTN